MTTVSIKEDDLGDLHNKVALVTGGANGIGKAMVELLHKLGSAVVFCDLDAIAGQAVESQIGLKIKFIKCNVTDWKELSAVFADIKQTHGRIDLVFANDGVPEDNSVFVDILDDKGALSPPNMAVIDVNLKALITTTKLALHYFKKNNPAGGGIVMTGSTSSYNERPNLPLYSAAKHGVIGLMRAVRHIAPAWNVNVGCIAPGGTESNMFPIEAADAFRAKGIPVNKAYSVALAAVFLATNPGYNGKALTIIGDRYTEVEGPILELQPQWYGEYNTEMARNAASVPLDKLSKQ